jgi:dTDP-4-dehydrorhamnose reductase
MLLTGATGRLGTCFRALLADFHAPSRSQFDLGRPGTMEGVLGDMRPDGIINCASYTAVDLAEDEPDVAHVVNADAVGVMASYAATAGIPFVTFSTDYVFDGEAKRPYLESDGTAPINVYGESKVRGERAALEAYPDALVVRTSWLMSATHPSFATGIVERAVTGPVPAVEDEIGSPTFAPDLATATLAALDAGVSGILHLVNAGAASRCELARVACATAGVDPSMVRPVLSADLSRRARRPRYSVLASERAERLGLPPLRTWEESLPDVFANWPPR